MSASGSMLSNSQDLSSILSQVRGLEEEKTRLVQLLEAERAELGGEAFDAVEREVNVLLSDVELVRAQGSELCSKSEQYCHTVEVSEFEFFFHSLSVFFHLLVTFCEVSLSVILT